MIPMSSTTRLWITPDQREPRCRWSAFPRTVEDPGPRRLSRAHAGFGVSWTRSAPSRRSPADHRGPLRQEKLTPAVSPMGHSRSDCRSPPRPEAATRAEQRKASRPVAAPAELRPNLVVCICTDDDLARFARALQFSEKRVPPRVRGRPLSRSADRLRHPPRSPSASARGRPVPASPIAQQQSSDPARRDDRYATIPGVSWQSPRLLLVVQTRSGLGPDLTAGLDRGRARPGVPRARRG
jgi:hypothetical protein